MLCSNFHLQTIVQTSGRISSIRANLMRPQGLPPQSGIYRWSEIIAPRSFPAFELLVFCVFDAENQDGGIFHCVNRTTPQKPALSQCEALVSWNLAQQYYFICSARRFNLSRNSCNNDGFHGRMAEG